MTSGARRGRAALGAAVEGVEAAQDLGVAAQEADHQHGQQRHHRGERHHDGGHRTTAGRPRWWAAPTSHAPVTTRPTRAVPPPTPAPASTSAGGPGGAATAAPHDGRGHEVAHQAGPRGGLVTVPEAAARHVGPTEQRGGDPGEADVGGGEGGGGGGVAGEEGGAAARAPRRRRAPGPEPGCGSGRTPRASTARAVAIGRRSLAIPATTTSEREGAEGSGQHDGQILGGGCCGTGSGGGGGSALVGGGGGWHGGRSRRRRWGRPAWWCRPARGPRRRRGAGAA